MNGAFRLELKQKQKNQIYNIYDVIHYDSYYDSYLFEREDFLFLTFDLFCCSWIYLAILACIEFHLPRDVLCINGFWSWTCWTVCNDAIINGSYDVIYRAKYWKTSNFNPRCWIFFAKITLNMEFFVSHVLLGYS